MTDEGEGRMANIEYSFGYAQDKLANKTTARNAE
jgi:hypothetical protein